MKKAGKILVVGNCADEVCDAWPALKGYHMDWAFEPKTIIGALEAVYDCRQTVLEARRIVTQAGLNFRKGEGDSFLGHIVNASSRARRGEQTYGTLLIDIRMEALQELVLEAIRCGVKHVGIVQDGNWREVLDGLLDE